MPWLIHSTALLALAESPDASTWAKRIERGQVRVCTTTLLELGNRTSNNPGSGKNSKKASGKRKALNGFLDKPPLSVMPIERLTPAAEQHAVHLQALLTEHEPGHANGHDQDHGPLCVGEGAGSFSVGDLLTAAAAHTAGLTLLHRCPDLDALAEVSGQSVERLAEPLPPPEGGNQ